MDNIRKMTTTITKDGDEATEEVRGVLDTALEKGRETWKGLGLQGKEAVAGAEKSVKEAWDDARKLLQKHPGKAAGLAFLVGAVIGGALMAMREKE